MITRESRLGGIPRLMPLLIVYTPRSPQHDISSLKGRTPIKSGECIGGSNSLQFLA